MARRYDDNDSGDGRGGGGRGKKGRQEIDLASSPNFSIRFISNAVQLAAGAVGARAGDLPWLQKALGLIEATLGQLGVQSFAALTAALVQNPRFVKNFLALLGVPADIIALADEALDSFVHGMVHAHTYDGKKITEKLEQDELYKARKKLEVLETLVSLREAITNLNLEQQNDFRNKMKEITDDADASTKEKLDRYLAVRGTMRRMVGINFVLVQLESQDWLAHLSMVFGEHKPATSAVEGFLGTVKATFKALDAQAEKLIAPPVGKKDPFVKKLKKFQRKLKRRTGQ